LKSTENVPKFEQTRKNPQKPTVFRRKPIDIAVGKVEGEGRTFLETLVNTGDFNRRRTEFYVERASSMHHSI